MFSYIYIYTLYDFLLQIFSQTKTQMFKFVTDTINVVLIVASVETHIQTYWQNVIDKIFRNLIKNKCKHMILNFNRISGYPIPL